MDDQFVKSKYVIRRSANKTDPSKMGPFVCYDESESFLFKIKRDQDLQGNFQFLTKDNKVLCSIKQNAPSMIFDVFDTSNNALGTITSIGPNGEIGNFMVKDPSGNKLADISRDNASGDFLLTQPNTNTKIASVTMSLESQDSTLDQTNMQNAQPVATSAPMQVPAAPVAISPDPKRRFEINVQTKILDPIFLLAVAFLMPKLGLRRNQGGMGARRFLRGGMGIGFGMGGFGIFRGFR